MVSIKKCMRIAFKVGSDRNLGAQIKENEKVH